MAQVPRGKRIAACPRCGAALCDEDGEPHERGGGRQCLNERRKACRAAASGSGRSRQGPGEAVRGGTLLSEALQQIPTIGEKTAGRLLARFGEDMLAGMLEDNLFEFINLMDEQGDLVFSDRQARRMERAMANMEFSFGQGGYPGHRVHQALSASRLLRSAGGR